MSVNSVNLGEIPYIVREGLSRCNEMQEDLVVRYAEIKIDAMLNYIQEKATILLARKPLLMSPEENSKLQECMVF